ncbi:glycoside hydrolase family 3 N-terminal domain-containing protein [Colwellia echini]|uniref:beta-N-acetylhexosaminidase n=1 Tax=Colwellia echini TaxID=1982103 RepID=A0ABY3N0V1_9GAMM|nr:glycoside hydrolase family 3 N-terminal domain-containing protein [Colwellia echini]TYK67114.1 glycoside hydrolase family 3 protein [Colwellia echini]
MNNKRINLQKLTDFEQQVAQRMSLDIRYYCADVNGKPSVPTSKHCRKGVTKLPEELATLISETSVGGIVLFAENVQNTAQIVKLTYDIQSAALKSESKNPLIISIDQEGGRVARFADMTGFAGNMAIGASYPKHGTSFATQVNAVIAKELKALGINNNYAPVIDVNTNADNPVINTRSFGESATQVAELGASAVNAIQAQDVMATLKHFPGHGDTHVDSHLGLPRVDHDRAKIDAVDLAPFTWAIKNSKPAMIMTAHIQYPVLDSSVFTSKSGDKLIRPATMSRKILTDLLRTDMAFDGIIATDALDMAGISQFFTEVEAVVETFIAGADLAVMPFKVKTPKDIANFYDFVKNVAKSLNDRIELEEYTLAEFQQSIARLNKYKQQYIKLPSDSIEIQIANAEKVIATTEHLNSEQALADAALTLLKNNAIKMGGDFNQQLIPISLKTTKQLHLVVANQAELDALSFALTSSINNVITNAINSKVISQEHAKINISYFIADDRKFNNINEKLIAQADVVIATLDIKTASLVDLGGMDDLNLSKGSGAKPSYGSKAQQQQKLTYDKLLKQQLTLAANLKTPSILIAKGSPFLLKQYSELADAVLLNFDDRIYQSKLGQKISPGYNASMEAILGNIKTTGKLPVSF